MTQLIKPQIQWTPDKIARFRAEYPLGDKQALAKELGCTYEALKSASGRWGVKSLKDIRHYRLKPLYDDSHLAYYWMGFIMADGQIDRKGELRVGLSAKDRDHLAKLAALLAANMQEGISQSDYGPCHFVRLSCKDAYYGPLLLAKYGLSDLPKTYNPPTLSISRDGYFLAFLLGMIDGDGTFSRNQKGHCDFIRLEMHASWTPVLEQMAARLRQIGIVNVTTGVTAKGYAHLRIYKHQNLRALKLFSLHHELPRLGRKWCSIDEHRVVSYMRAGDRVLKAEDLFEL